MPFFAYYRPGRPTLSLSLTLTLLSGLPKTFEAVRVIQDLSTDANLSDARVFEDGLDWSTQHNPLGRGVVTVAEDQGGYCNSCYVWAAVGSLESRAAIATGQQPVQLSVQQALDCARADHMKELGKGRLTYRSSRGCQTGFPKPILQYALDEGFMLAAEYPVPYDIKGAAARKDGPCLVDTAKLAWHPSPSAWKLKGVSSFAASWEAKVKKALADGPIAIGIAKDSHKLGGDPVVRAGGIASKDCRSTVNDHAVLLVGFGEIEGKPYWKIRNSWGPVWGNGGFFKIPRGVNFCGAETTAGWLEEKKKKQKQQ